MCAIKRFWKGLGGLAVPILLLNLCVPAFGVERNGNVQLQQNQATMTKLEKKIRRELVMLPYYTVFDNLEFQIEDNDTLVLSGQVTWPNLKSDAEHAAEKIEGVKKVINKIEVLPLSPFDNTIRRREFYAIYGSIGFERYAVQAVPPIHIIVNNGNVTLVGIVADQFDKRLAEIAAKEVPQVFSITNNLQVEHAD
jgi:hyperosmotically inducible protein